MITISRQAIQHILDDITLEYADTDNDCGLEAIKAIEGISMRIDMLPTYNVQSWHRMAEILDGEEDGDYLVMMRQVEEPYCQKQRVITLSHDEKGRRVLSSDCRLWDDDKWDDVLYKRLDDHYNVEVD